MQKEYKKNSKQIENRKKSALPWYKDLRFYFISVLFLLMIALVAQLFIVKIIPMKYIAGGVVVLALLALMLCGFSMGSE